VANEELVDVVMVGAGIMSATLATLLSELQPGMTFKVFERLGDVAQESSKATNNAGTGHAANCELNYTPRKPDGSVDIAKALAINSAFETTLQFWSYLVEKGALPRPLGFLNPVPHQSLVWGEANTQFLRTRHAQLSAHPMFKDMEYTEDPAQLAAWMPLTMEGREPGTALAATHVPRGTDVDFGRLTRLMFDGMKERAAFELHLNHEVKDLEREPDGLWRVRALDLAAGTVREVRARFVFLGAGGAALTLLRKSKIKEGKGYGGFPVSGQWLMCSNPEVIRQHHSKVYGMASLGAPPMSVPHLDTRIVDGRQSLLFGPFAGFTTKYLKTGSYLDMIRAIGPGNIWPMLAAGWHNLDLTRYLIGQVLQSPEQRLAELRKFVPTAKLEDWKLEIAGQRVQIIKGDPKLGGKLEFGTEVVAAADGSLAALLGASPGASTAATTMIYLILRCFSEQAQTPAWQERLKKIVPSFGHDLTKEFDLLRSVRDRNDAVLGLAEHVHQTS
jgi:malate dehydrogenase (quinone)